MRTAMAMGLMVVVLAACGGDGTDSQDALQQQVAALEDQMADLEVQLADAEAAGAASASTIASLQGLLATAQADLATASASLATSSASVATLTTQVATLQGQITTLNGILASLAGTVQLDVPFMFGSSPLALGTSYPITGTTDTVSFSEVRYWLSNVELVHSDGSAVAIPNSIYLVEARGAQDVTNGTEDTVTLAARRREQIVIPNVPAGVYASIRFRVGVDAAHNDDLSNAGGELHILQNMTFDNGWMWFTSYIFTKTKGTVGGTGGSAAFAWDNGSNADYRTVTLPMFSTPIAVSAQHPAAIHVDADLSNLVEGVSPRTNATIGAGTPAARTTLADQFRDMFELVSAGAAP